MTSATYQLIMRSGPTPEKVFELTQPVTFIGREFSNEIVINDAEISRRHARLTAQTGGFVLDDMGSTNGTFVNGQRLLGPHLLRPGELITFGEKVSLSFEMQQFDPNATVVSPVNLPPYQEPYPPAVPYGAPAAGGQPPVQAVPNYPSASQPSPSPRQTYAPSGSSPAYYSGQIPESPTEAELPEERKRGSRTWLLLGIGCLLVFLCVCVGVAFAFDTLNLYCVPPFGAMFNFLYACP
jgi:predicted component of type VI protein secretion system